MKKLIFAFLICASTIPALSQIQKQWSVIHFPYGNSQNVAYLQKDQLMLNSIGDVVGGWRFTIVDSGIAVGTTSYDFNGNFNWENAYLSSISNMKSICIDSLNNVYTLGTVNVNLSTEDNVILKFDAGGNIIWLIGEDSIDTWGIGAALANDKLCVLSRNHPSMYRYDIITGAVIDTVEIDSIGIGIGAFSDNGLLKVSMNDVYYGGQYYTPTGYDLYASKIINGDSVLWKSTIYATNAADIVQDITIDEGGNLYLLGFAAYNSGARYAIVCKLDGTTGDSLWSAEIKSPTVESYPSDIATDNAGHIYVASDVGNDTLQRFQLRITQFNSLTGQLNWYLDFDSLYQEGNRYSKICVDSTTKDILVAYTLRPAISYIRTAIIRIDSSGTVLWQSVFDTLGTLEALVYDQQGNLYMAGGILTKFSLVTDIEEQINYGTNNLNAYFNNEINSINISASAITGKKYMLSIIDDDGRIVYTEDGAISFTFRKAVPFTRRKDGLYLVILETEKERLTGKVVVF